MIYVDNGDLKSYNLCYKYCAQRIIFQDTFNPLKPQNSEHALRNYTYKQKFKQSDQLAANEQDSFLDANFCQESFFKKSYSCNFSCSYSPFIKTILTYGFFEICNFRLLRWLLSHQVCMEHQKEGDVEIELGEGEKVFEHITCDVATVCCVHK